MNKCSVFFKCPWARPRIPPCCEAAAQLGWPSEDKSTQYQREKHSLALCFFSSAGQLLCSSSKCVLNSRGCLHWQYDWNKHIKPCWAFLSKQSLWSAGWHGHSKYSWEHFANGAKGAALCDLPVAAANLYILHFRYLADSKGSYSECRMLQSYSALLQGIRLQARVRHTTFSSYCFYRVTVLEGDEIDLVIYALRANKQANINHFGPWKLVQ